MIPWKVELHDELGSTNDRAWEIGGAEPTAVIARTQTRGRGQHGRTWSSPAGTGLYVSYVWRPDVHPSRLPMIPLAAGLAVVDAVPGAPLTLKWPNDVWVQGGSRDGCKVAGILAEGSAGTDGVAFMVVGVGLNLLTDSARAAPSARPCSLEELGLDPVAMVAGDDLLRGWAQRLGARLAARVAQDDATLVRDWTQRAYGLSRLARWTDGKAHIVGTVRGVEPSGGLQLATESGLRVVHHGRIEAFLATGDMD